MFSNESNRIHWIITIICWSIMLSLNYYLISIFIILIVLFYRKWYGENKNNLIHFKPNLKMGECKSTTKTTSAMMALLFLIIDPCGK